MAGFHVQQTHIVDPFGQMLKGYDDRIKSTYDRALKEVQIAKAWQSLDHAEAGEGRSAALHRLRTQLVGQQIKTAEENARLLGPTHDAQLEMLQLRNQAAKSQEAYDAAVRGYAAKLLPGQFKQAEDGLNAQPGPQQRFGAGRTLNKPAPAQPTQSSSMPGIVIDQPKPPKAMHLGNPPDPLTNPFEAPVGGRAHDPLEIAPRADSYNFLDVDDDEQAELDGAEEK